MKINSIGSIFFQKKLIATCAVKGSKSNIPCSFYQLEDSDKDYFIKLIYKPGWKDYLYAMIIDGDIRRKDVDKIYVLEDKMKNCLGFMKVDTKFEDANSLEFIEVIPNCRAKNNRREKSYIGETMLNFLAQLTRLQEKEFLSVPYPDSDAVDFYRKCHFTPTGYKRACIIGGDEMDELKKSNLKHTGSTISFIG